MSSSTRKFKIRDELILKSGTVQATILLLEIWIDSRGISVKRVYEWMRSQNPPRPCFRTIWHSICEPKHSFMVWLATPKRLPTKDRLRLGNGDTSCVLCSLNAESHSHLFFQCTFVSDAWEAIRQWMHINCRITTIRSG